MRFSEQESALLLLILKNENLISLEALIEKLEQREYIKGRLLNQLYSAVSKSKMEVSESQKDSLISLLKRIKFKATPR